MGKFYDDTFVFKILLIGDSTVGKSSLLEKYINNNFLWQSLATIGVDFQAKNISYMNQKIKLQIWDTAGQERYRTITDSYYREADYVVLCYDITNKETFANLDDWIKTIKDKAPEDAMIYIVGTKLDQIDQREIDEVVVLKFAAERNVSFCETSSKTFNKDQLDNILFKPIIRDLYERDKLVIEKGPTVENNKHLIMNKETCCTIV